MAAISINLLPPELEKTKKQRTKQLLAIQISIGILVVIIGIATFVLIFRLSQNVNLTDLKKQEDSLNSRLNSQDYQLKEGLVRSLKERIDTVQTISKKETAGSFAYSLLLRITPDDISYESVTLDKKANLVLTGKVGNNSSLEALFNRLADPNVNGNQIVGTNIDSLSRDSKGMYRFELTVTLLGGALKKS